MFNIFDSCDVASCTNIIIQLNKSKPFEFPFTCLCSGLPLGIMALLATVAAVKGDKS